MLYDKCEGISPKKLGIVGREMGKLAATDHIGSLLNTEELATIVEGSGDEEGQQFQVSSAMAS